jgi:hypothetical protein
MVWFGVGIHARVGVRYDLGAGDATRLVTPVSIMPFMIVLTFVTRNA